MQSNDRSTRLDQDTLLELVIRLDDSALFKMYNSPLWQDQIRALLTNPHTRHAYWYGRTQLLAGTPLDDGPGDWKDIYYALGFRNTWEDIAFKRGKPNDWNLILKKMESPQIRSVLGLESATEFRVLSKLYPVPKALDRDIKEKVWGTIDDPGALQAALDGRLLYASSELAEGAFTTAVARGRKTMIDPLLALISPERKAELEVFALSSAQGKQAPEIVKMMLDRVTDENDIEQAFLEQARMGSSETVELFLDRITNRDMREQGAERAAKYGNGTGLRAFLSRVQFSLKYKQELFRSAYDNEAEGSMLVLIEDDPRNVAAVDPYLLSSHQFLLESIRNRYNRLIPLLLQNVDPTAHNNEALRAAATRATTFAIVLADPRINPMPSVRGIITRSRHIDVEDHALMKSIEDNLPLVEIKAYTDYEPIMRVGQPAHRIAESVADILIRDPRVDIERLDRPTLHLVFWSLQTHIADRIEGLQKGREMVGSTRLDKEQLGELLELKDDIYAKLLRFITLKRPSNEQLVDWMTAQTGVDRETFAFAAGDVLDDVIEPDETITPIWALLRIALYPSLTPTRLVNRLRESGVEQELITRSAQLVGAHLGAERLK